MTDLPMSDLRIKRRDVLKGAVAVAAGTILSPHVSRAATKKVTFTLPWVPEGGNLFAYVAKANGYWEKAGLDVTISRGYGSVAAAQAIGNGQFDFGLAAASAGLQQSAKGLPIVQFMSCGYDSTMGICFRDDSAVKSVKDLEGRRLGGTATSGEFPFLGAFAEKAGFDLKKVEIVQVDAAVRQRILTEKQVDAICGFAVSFLPVFAANGLKTRFTLFSKYGLSFYANTLMTQPDRIAKDPEACQGIADGIAQAMHFCLLNPDKSLEIFFKQVPEAALTATGRTQMKVGLGIFRIALLNDILRKEAIGFSPPADYEAMTDLVMTHLAAPGDKRPTIDEVLTNKFVGSVRLTADEFKTASDGAAEFASYLA